MSSAPTNAPPQETFPDLGVGLLRICAAVGLMMLLFASLGVNTEHLLIGWLYFLLEAVPQMTVDWPSAGLGIMSFLLLVSVLHRTAGWWTAQRWTLTNTFLLTGTLTILFISGTAVVGGTHQAVWLFTGRDSSPASPEYPGVLFEARDAARKTECRYHLMELSMGLLGYHDSNDAFPPGGIVRDDGELLHGWALPLAPYVGFTPPASLDLQQSWRAAENRAAYQCQLPCFVNPSLDGELFDEAGFGLCHYAANVHVLPVTTMSPAQTSQLHRWQFGQGTSLDDIDDSLSGTILIGTVAQNLRPWVTRPMCGIRRWELTVHRTALGDLRHGRGPCLPCVTGP